MVSFASRRKRHHAVLSEDFERELTREVLRTELLRVRALIMTGCVMIVFLTAIYLIDPAVVNRVWRGTRGLLEEYGLLIGFILLEVWIYTQIRRNLRLNRDLPVVRRYIGALIETSLPTVILILQIRSMGASQALGFAVPLIYFIFVILSTLRLDFWLSTFTGFVAAAQLFAVALIYDPSSGIGEPQTYFHAVRSIIILVCGVLAGTVGAQLRRQFAASIAAATARDRVTNLFGQHVSPQVVDRLMTQGTSAGGDVRRVAVMFVDFRGFTAGAQTRSPQEVVDRLDGAFAVLVDILDREGGIVNKFLGDGFLALFGAPLEASDAAHRAVAAGREMLTAMDHINAQTSWPLRIGIGIHFGEVVAGNIGSPRRKEYTVIGDTVNFASRLEALNKEFGSQLLISASVREALGDDGGDAVALGEVAVRGYEQPVAVFRLG
ncbi:MULTISPECIES: adenylate/guanylate cyclase domain-containing protein [unclassified Bradyrhizobium]|uniref:adenylate/guanylate cyclase domain-containing protein n=1 Tax=unclassified Bradyrhizobium TaxID=2631580 RepID=UPI0024789C62|nr:MULTISPECIES: adenylate/guanylate cyclase domain-containing protein [unclassified Bradyrhizobium]WGR74169.1 adenylate/guanylate cyclase domain-containing protein [Bradyrhizobium sp. ISRA426]WGR79004.1 adenylate/guanylate cyclase domain-containing protein [Bradyrhizobium sp. ISRA430]WGR89408.1 adenylate/guanylate cyclase domain-containing protein [Bradyrhizobium sp. ISRA432]